MRRSSVLFVVFLAFLMLFAFGQTVLALEGEECFYVEKQGEEYALILSGETVKTDEHLSSLLDGSVGKGATLIFKDVVTEESLIFEEAELTFSGSLKCTNTLVIQNSSKVIFKDFELIGNDGAVSVIDSNLKIIGGLIDSQRIALSAGKDADVKIEGGRISTSSNLPTLKIERGSVEIKKGQLLNTAGHTIENRGRLTLSGEENISGASYDIITDRSVLFASEGKNVSVKLDIKYDYAFEYGSLTPILENVEKIDYSGVKIYDSNGKRQDLTYFTEYDGYVEKNFAAVYLPFEINYFLFGKKINTSLLLNSEAVLEFIPDIKKGYTLLGWYVDSALEEKFIFGKKADSNLNLYAECLIDPVEYSIAEMNFEFDGTEHIVSFSSLSHPLDGNYTFVWMAEDGSVVSRSRSFSVKNVKDSGKYKCLIRFSCGSFSSETETPFINVEVSKKIVATPEIPDQIYTGRLLYPDIPPSPYYTAEDIAYTNAGVYKIKLQLSDTENYRWEKVDFDGAVFEIKKAENSWSTYLTVNDCFLSSAPNFLCRARFGNVEYYYAESEDGVFSLEYPNKAGDYYVKACVGASSNWTYLESDALPFSIVNERAVALDITGYPKKTVYNSFDSFDPEGLILKVKYDSGRETLVYAGECKFDYQSADTFRVGDSGIKIIYQELDVIVPVTVKPLKYVFDIDFKDESRIYNGKYYSIDCLSELPVGKDGIPLTAVAEGGGSNVGVYTVKLRFDTESSEYLIPEDITAKLEILPYKVSVVWGGNKFVYDGSAKIPTAYYIDIYGAKIFPKINGERIEATESCVAEAVCSDKNYLFINPTTTFSIAKADYDMSSVRWEYSDFIYCGEAYSVSLRNLPTGVSVIGYVNNIATDAGRYTASAIFNYDKKNYNEPHVNNLDWSIAKADYQLDSFSFEGGSYIYDGEKHYPTLKGKMPVGKDGIALTYRFSGGAINVSDSNKRINIEFLTDSKNYNTPKGTYAFVEILPKSITVVWSNERLVYTADVVSPTATSQECEIKVIASGVNAGRYSAFALAENPNFTVKNDRFEYVIEKATNYWTQSPSIQDVYYGKGVDPFATAAFGTVIYKYFKDEALSEEIGTPEEIGGYFMLACVPESENYLYLESSPVFFEIIPLEPLGLRVEIQDGARFTAFEKISPEDIICRIELNDGQLEYIDFENIGISYSCGEVLKAGYVKITFSYMNFECPCEVFVEKANYDMSGVVWSDTSYIYDGTEKFSELYGLPLGVTVLEYYGVGKVDAGEYELGALISYDTENYNEPVLPVDTLVIQKKGVRPGIANKPIYNKTSQIPVSDSDLYSPVLDSEYINAGTYKINFTLLENKNHFLIESFCDYIILPKEVDVSVGNARIYWDGFISDYHCDIDTTDVSYEDLQLEYYISDNKLMVRSGNPNYKLNVISGNIERSFGFSRNTLLFIMWAVLIIILLCLVLLIFIYKREVVFSGVAALKSRYAHKKESSNISTDSISVLPLNNLSVDVKQAESLLTDSIAKTLIRKKDKIIETVGRKKCIINVDTLSENFKEGETVNINVLKDKGLVPKDCLVLRVLARGSINKPLTVEANYFSLTAVKMIALTGGEVYKVNTKSVRK